MMTLEGITGQEYLALNAQLQKKKNLLRQKLRVKGVLKRNGKNDYDKYSYFSESQYKQLFTELLADTGLELRFNETEYTPFQGTEKQPYGRFVKIEFQLIDTSTGFFESTAITGEGLDKGDKAGYKAYTGAIKYYLADTFLVATGDDPEGDKFVERENLKAIDKKPITPAQLAVIRNHYTGDKLAQILKDCNVSRLEEIPCSYAITLIRELNNNSNRKG